MKEIWKPFPYDSLYLISNYGRVKSSKRGKLKLLKNQSNPDGRQQLSLSVRGEIATWMVHRLVLLTFVGEPPSGCEASHLNGNNSDNVISNLKWESHKANMCRMSGHVKNTIGSNNGRSKLNEEKVLEIKGHLFRGVHHKAIADQYCVCMETINLISMGKTWKHVK